MRFENRLNVLQGHFKLFEREVFTPKIHSICRYSYNNFQKKRCFYWVDKPSRNLGFISVSGKVLPVTPPLSGVFVHRVFCAYFGRFDGAGVMRSLLCTINL